MKPTREWLERHSLLGEGNITAGAPAGALPLSEQVQAQRHVFAPVPCDDRAFGLVRVAQPYVALVQGRASNFRLVWIKRNKARDVFIHCETSTNGGATAAESAEVVRQHMSELGVPRDALWFEATSRTTLRNEELFSIFGHNYVLTPVEFPAGHATRASSTSFAALGKRLGLDPTRLEQLCQLAA